MQSLVLELWFNDSSHATRLRLAAPMVILSALRLWRKCLQVLSELGSKWKVLLQRRMTERKDTKCSEFLRMWSHRVWPGGSYIGVFFFKCWCWESSCTGRSGSKNWGLDICDRRSNEWSRLVEVNSERRWTSIVEISLIFVFALGQMPERDWPWDSNCDIHPYGLGISWNIMEYLYLILSNI